MSLFNGKEENENVVTPVTVAPVAAATEEKKETIVSVESTKSEVGFISAGTKVDGNITSTGHLILNGEITGTTNVEGNVVLNGTVLGDIKCDSILMNKASSSNVSADNNVIIKAKTTVKGNVNCKNITVYGVVDGDISAKDSVVLKNTAVVNGNIEAARIGVETGAKLNGKVSIR